MTYLEILSYARKGIQAEIDKHRAMQEKALEGQAHDIARYAQETIDALEVKRATLEDFATYAKAKGESLTAFLIRCARAEMERNPIETPQEHL